MKRHTGKWGMVFLLGLAWVGGCSNGLEDVRFPTGSHVMISSSSYDALYVANATEGTLSRVTLEGGAVSEQPVGSQPTRLARAGDTVWVTLRGEGKIRPLKEVDGALIPGESVEVGAEPYGVVAREDGDRIYVAVSLENRVEEREGSTGALVRSWSIPDQPRWLALHPGGESLYVASAFNGRLTRVLLSEDSTETVETPQITSFAMNSAPHPFSVRLTGDPVVVPDGSAVVVPALYVDNVDPVPSNDEVHSRQAIEERRGFEEEADGYASGGRLNPVVLHIPVDSSGEPRTDEAEAIAVEASSFDSSGDHVTVAGYPTSVTSSAKGRFLAVTMEGSDAVVVINRVEPGGPDAGFSVSGMLFGEGDEFDMEEFENEAFFGFREAVVARTPAGPQGLTLTGGSVGYVYSFLDRTVSRLKMRKVYDQFLDFSGDSGFLMDFDSGEMILESVSTVDPVVVSTSTLPAAIEAGRRLFYTSVDPRMSAEHSGVSCATCHNEGRNDGLSWHFSDGPRQTPSLAGEVSLTEPVTWRDEVTTVVEEVVLTSQGRMGGAGLSSGDAGNVAAFVDWVRLPDLPVHPGDEATLEWGRQLFFSEAVGCSGCHLGAVFTDNQSHRINGVMVQTRSLLGVMATPPYFHDGSLLTLEDVLEYTRAGGMGDTSGLTDEERGALLLYLKSL